MDQGIHSAVLALAKQPNLPTHFTQTSQALGFSQLFWGKPNVNQQPTVASSVEISQETIMGNPAQLQDSLMETHVLSHEMWKANGKTDTMPTTALASMVHMAAPLEEYVDMGDIVAPYVAASMEHNSVPWLPDFLPIVTPLIADAWEQELLCKGLYHIFSDVPSSI
ncbi:hypothetical protein P691DRAFT_788162 [Macrolepiota fuliginosa MF-IS2]|uniref:Uncharacterized protein n=1 Tax=Macrolepiota fuliginosa MF-IS2 TaxID=1400762 RepID=A0A9P5X4R0_9AGAR|nr:hypothetical protein P691DRAFT_788162 [Macrolepiota fuliginosa MF-IS2]